MRLSVLSLFTLALTACPDDAATTSDATIEATAEPVPETATETVAETSADTVAETSAEATDTTVDTSETTVAPRLEWAPLDATGIASGAEVKLAFNNTTVGTRLSDGTALVTWTSAGVPMLGRRPAGGGTWTSIALPKFGTAPASKVSLVDLGGLVGGELFAGWTEGSNLNAVAVASHSIDGGLNWDAARVVSAAAVGAESVTATAVIRAGQPVSVIMAWYEGASKNAHFTVWTGPTWTADAFTASAPLESHAGTSHDVAVVAREAHAVSIWEDDSVTPVVLRFAESSDGGRTWGAARDMNGGADGTNVGQDASACIDGQDRIVIGFQRQSQIYVARVTPGGAISNVAQLGPGLFGHTVCDTFGFGAVAWEHFTGGDSKDDAVKTIGLSTTLDDFGAIDGPHAMPDSSSAFGRVQSLAVLSGDLVDVYWIDTGGATRTLWHREARIVR